MSEAQFDKLVDEWVAKRNQQIGKVQIPQVGSYPPQLEVGVYGTQHNEFVTTDLIRHYAEAIGDKNPLWRSHDYARRTTWGGIIAPPTFTDSIGISWGIRAISREGLSFSLQALPAGSRRQWSQVIRPGDRFRLVDKYLGITEKKPKREKPYRLFIDTIEREYINQREETAAVVHRRQTVLALPSMDSVDEEHPLFSGGSRHRRRLTDEERDAVYRGYEEAKGRGADTLFWEDVALGQELKPLVVGPVGIWDTAAFLAAMPGYAVAFDIEWERIKLDFKFACLDTEVNAWKSGGEGHLCDGAGHSVIMSGGHAFTYGAQIEGLICRSLYNWMGDAGFLKLLDSQFRNIPIQGDLYRIKGKVTNKTMEAGEPLVDLQVHCENQDGLILVPGTARVRLISRTKL